MAWKLIPVIVNAETGEVRTGSERTADLLVRLVLESTRRFGWGGRRGVIAIDEALVHAVLRHEIVLSGSWTPEQMAEMKAAWEAEWTAAHPAPMPVAERTPTLDAYLTDDEIRHVLDTWSGGHDAVLGPR